MKKREGSRPFRIRNLLAFFICGKCMDFSSNKSNFNFKKFDFETYSRGITPKIFIFKSVKD